ncbi:MAG: DNA/RNA nuclease SfsA [Geminicoccaceae bacterium]
MILPGPLQKGRLVKRYKRFLADIELDEGELITAHCPNPGRMLGLNVPGATVWVAPSRGKLSHRLEMVEVEGRGLVGINTGYPNHIVREALLEGRVAQLQGYGRLRSEVAYGTNSRIDLLLEDEARPDCYVEIKNVHYEVDGAALFPDSVTARGTKHLGELERVVAAGRRGVIFYCVQRMDCSSFALAESIDPVYAQACRRAVAHGVEALCYHCRVELGEITLERELSVEL